MTNSSNSVLLNYWLEVQVAWHGVCGASWQGGSGRLSTNTFCVFSVEEDSGGNLGGNCLTLARR